MDCCSINGLDEEFGRSGVQKEVKKYLKNGLGKYEQMLLDTLKAQGISGASILEVGGGIGSLHLELIKAGAAGAVGYEVSSASVDASTALADRLGLGDLVDYHLGDFVEHAPSAPEADIVLLNGVICCYPDVKALVASSAQRARRLYLFTLPRRAWWTRVLASALNVVQALRRKHYRAFVHDPELIATMLRAEGMGRIFHRTVFFLGVWEVAVYQRQPEPSGALVT